ncbi:MAG: CDP-glycerol glycerophosphotransferase family protein [Ruminococcus sp.]|nr:CDP-glycerol glycerophosphotransferase family protein [Ruminococcus sp.]
MKERIAVFAYSGSSEEADEYALFLLKAARESFSYIITSVSKDCPDSASAEIGEISDKVLVSENKAPFSAYSEGIRYIKENGLDKKYAEAVLLDDFFSKPICSFEELFGKIDGFSDSPDFWSISGAAEASPNGVEHLQPHFIAVSKKMLASSEFADFLDNAKGDFFGHFSGIGFKPAVIEADNLADIRKNNRSAAQAAAVIGKSRLFNRGQYISKYPEALRYGLPPEYHYLNIGWRKGFDPSDEFSSTEYLRLNSDVKQSGICPLLHFERYGKRERRPYKTENGSMVRANRPLFDLKFIGGKAKNLLRQVKYYFTLKVDPNKILFHAFQNDYTCNPKYICEELLRQDLPFEIVWIADKSGKKDANFPSRVRLVKSGTPQAMAEIMTSKIIIDNGVLPFRNKLFKKKEQISINTWHGSLGFKRLDGNQLKKTRMTSMLYNQINDYIISDSDFEDNVFRTSNWQKTEFIKCGHPRNDILISCGREKAELIKAKVYSACGIPENQRAVLYAPTFREKIVDTEPSGQKSEELDLDILCGALEEKFGGEWCVLMRAHFVNAKSESSVFAERHRICNATDYPDIQELMIAADAGVTDYSSWILDYMYTRKPAFLYTPDYEDYDMQRGFYYPLSESPFPAAKNNKELSRVIKEFDGGEYSRKIDEFLKSKGSREDGCGSKAAAEAIKKLMNYKEDKSQ